jgi:hypothetical protein
LGDPLAETPRRLRIPSLRAGPRLTVRDPSAPGTTELWNALQFKTYS